jgi:hypothetical protein
MYGYTITGYLPTAFWNPYGKPPPVAADLGGLSAAKFPFGAEELAEPARPSAPPRRLHATTLVPPVEKTEPPGVLVPEPPGVNPAPPPAKGSGYPIVPGPTP